MLRQNKLKLKLKLCCQRKSEQPVGPGTALDFAEKNGQENSGLFLAVSGMLAEASTILEPRCAARPLS
jgi:hypothetical protein